MIVPAGTPLVTPIVAIAGTPPPAMVNVSVPVPELRYADPATFRVAAVTTPPDTVVLTVKPVPVPSLFGARYTYV